MDEKPRERWFKFSLWAIFALTVIVLFTVWAVWSLNWISQRHEFIRDKVDPTGPTRFSNIPPDVPGLLWIFGEESVEFIVLKSASDAAEAKRLFPEVKKVIDPRVWNAP